MKAKVLAENSLLILLFWRFSQSRINSKAISHMKNSWKVLPFHINSNDAGCKEYSQRNGTAKASSGKSLISVLVCSLTVDRMVCILCYQTRIDSSITVSLGFKKDVHSVRQVFREKRAISNNRFYLRSWIKFLFPSFRTSNLLLNSIGRVSLIIGLNMTFFECLWPQKRKRLSWEVAVALVFLMVCS